VETPIFERQSRLKSCPPAQLVYILYRRIIEHGLRTTWLWIGDKVARRTYGFSPPAGSEILPGLYVGGQHRSRGLAGMRQLGITAVVNMRDEADDEHRGVALDAYLWLPTIDDSAPTLDDLARGVKFIAEQRSAGRGVYIHCASGVGRAPTMAAAYLVSQGADPEEAWATILQGRPFVRPTPPQLEVIRAFAAECAGRHQGPNPTDAMTKPCCESERRHEDQHRPPETDPAHLEAREQVAFERLSGDGVLTGELTDDAATELLRWARARVHQLVAATAAMEEQAAWDTLDPRLHALRRRLRRGAALSAASPHPEATLSAWLAALDETEAGDEQA
jgi:hypothetical protein